MNNSADYLEIAYRIGVLLEQKGRPVIFVDVSDQSVVSRDEFNPYVLKLFGQASPKELIIPFLKEIGEFRAIGGSSCAAESDLKLSGELGRILDLSVNSAMMTYLRDDSLNRLSIFRKVLSRRLREEAVQLLSSLDRMELPAAAITVHLPNGRFPHQRALEEWASGRGFETWYYESGKDSLTYFHQPYSALDRESCIQDAFSRDWATIGVCPRKSADEWIAERASSNFNPFASRFKSTYREGDFDFTFFTSSQDEYFGLGPAWQKQAWKSQWEPIEAVLELMPKTGVRVCVRVHPNSINKSFRNHLSNVFSALRLKRRFPFIHLVLGSGSVNSYKLIEHSRMVYVWDSTIGLEATLLGTPAASFALTYYGEESGVRALLDSDAISEFVQIQTRIHSEARAKQFVDYLEGRDSSKDLNFHSLWLENFSTLGHKLAKALSLDGTPNLWLFVLYRLTPKLNWFVSSLASIIWLGGRQVR